MESKGIRAEPVGTRRYFLDLRDVVHKFFGAPIETVMPANFIHLFESDEREVSEIIKPFYEPYEYGRIITPTRGIEADFNDSEKLFKITRCLASYDPEDTNLVAFLGQTLGNFEEDERNEKIYRHQGNKNPFVLYPEFADLISDF